ncbi:TPA: GtrA family protein [Stenotrophomonas maltophilia]
MRALSERMLASEVVRYGINGLLATALHFMVLYCALEVWGFRSAGLANGAAACVGIAASFMGSRYFVFRASSGSFVGQGVRFVALYAVIALLHALVLYLWSDRAGWDYRLGFLVATCVQVACSFLANKLVVFK